MSEFTDVYKELIILQYYPKPKAQGEIKLWSDEFENVYDFVNEFFTEFDLDLATGDRLDKIGKIVGISRIVEGGVAKKFFGYIGAANVLGYDEGRYFVEGDDLYTDSELTDGQYRLFIKAKISKNNASAIMVGNGRDGLQDAIQSLFNGEAYVIDNQDMSLNLYVNDDLPTDDLILIVQADLLPKPQAVRYRWIVQIPTCVPIPLIRGVATASLNATNQLFKVPDNNSWDFRTRGMTTVAYIKLNAGFNSTGCIIAKWGETILKEFNLVVLSDRTVRLQFFNFPSTTVTLNGTQVLNTGQWYSVAMTISGSNTALGSRKHAIVIDAVEDVSAFDDRRIEGTTPQITIGALNEGAANSSDKMVSHFDGAIGFAGIWGRDLNTAELSDVTNGGDALCYDELEIKSPSITDFLISYYHLATFTEHTTDALTDQHGSNDLTNVNSTPFADNGLDVECTPTSSCDGTFGYEGAPNATGYDSGIYADIVTLP